MGRKRNLIRYEILFLYYIIILFCSMSTGLSKLSKKKSDFYPKQELKKSHFQQNVSDICDYKVASLL